MAGKPRVLIVDDDPAIRRMINEMLGLEGYPVESAQNGQEAIDLIGSGRSYVILLDLLMPVMDGREFMQELEARPTERARHKVILVSAFERLEQARDLKADGRLAKPFTMDQLTSAIEAAGLPA